MAVRKELSSLLIISCFLATTGYCYQQQQEDQTFSTEELCRQSLLNTTLHTAITAARNQASPCPCTQNVMELDVTFRFQQGCYVQMFYENGVKQKCCYDNYGNLMVGAPNGGYITVEQYEQDIEMAKHACCQDSQTCDDFYSFNPSDDCSTFKVLHPAKSWGDPQITTIDHHTFSFNGHGEYVYLLLNGSSGAMEIQARTDYLEKGNTDATIFVAFVIHAEDGTGNKYDLLHVHLDKVNDSVAVYLDNNARLDTSNARLTSSLFNIIYKNKSSVLIMSSVLPVRVEISYLKNLGLAVSVLTRMNGSGLAGSTKNNKFVDRNGLNYSLDASEAKLFNYSESWSVRNENESNFNYNLTVDGGNFTFYNSSHTTPRFLESRVNNLTELFEDWSSENITTFNNTCHIKWNNSVSNACLLAIARSKNLESGKEVIAEMERQHDLKRRAENKPPTFKPNMVTHVFVNYSDSESFTIDLSKYVEDANNDTLTFGVVTSINSSTYTIDNTTGLFTWHVGGQARQEEVTLTFLVKDEFSERPSSLFISYCGCQKEEQCDFTFLEPLNSTGKFERYGCSCTGLYASGRFCESRINPCDTINCSSGFLNLACDNSSDADNPCEPCPSGYQSIIVTTPTRQQNCTNMGVLRSYDSLKSLCSEMDLQKPEQLTSVKLRKYTATIAQVFDLSSQEQSWLVNHLGHSMDIHKIHYRQTSRTIERLDIAKLMLLQEFNITAKYAGRKLCDIDLKEVCTDDSGNIVLSSEEFQESQESSVVHDDMEEGCTDVEGYIPDDDIDIDECKEESPCDHLCNDTDGGYNCSCYKGFALDFTNNRTCIDIDECKEGKKVCKLNEVCYDPQGNATCICVPGFSRSSDKDKCKKIDGFLYTFTMALVVTDPGPLPPPIKNDAKQMLCKALNNSINFTDVIINRVFYDKISNRSRKRRETGSYYLHIDYTVLMKENTAYSVLQSNLTKLLKEADIDDFENISVSLGSSFTIEIAKGGSCSLGDDCHKASSHCVDNNGTLSCECNHGFKKRKKGLKFCEDIDECTEGNLNLTEICFGGTCENKYNGWNCTCPSNTTWAKIGDDVYPYSYRCQGNHSYIGNISLYRHGNNRYKQDDFTSFLQELFKVWFDNETVISGHTPSLKDLFVKTSVFHLNVIQEYYHGKPSGYWYNCSFILTLGDAVNTSRLDSALQSGKKKELKPDNCTTEGDDCKVFYVNLYYDSDDILCNLGNKCDMYTTTCDASYGVYRCECKQGFARFDNYNCRDINECEEPVSHKSCSLNNGTCQNSFGDWSCTCKDGYNTTNYSFDNRTCEDVDECSELHPCQGNHDCFNTEGSWKCTCKGGYNETSINSTHTECADIDECLGEYCNGTCYNTDGSFICECPDGFNATAFENRSIACIDIDECEEPVSHKSCSLNNGTCQNSFGDWSCTCKDGYNTTNYSFDNRTCEDVDECSEFHPCQGSHDCVNTEGSWKCTCKEGYNETSINSTHTECVDKNECEKIDQEYFCLNEGECRNLPGNWTCNCRQGYEAEFINETHYDCKDVDECKNGKQCENGNCSNTDGNFTCSCPEDLDEPVTNSQNIIICSGSNLYRFTETITFSRKLNETELQIAQTELEEKIQRRYNSEFSDIKVTVIVTITKFTRKRRESTNSTKYHMTTKIISRVQGQLKEFRGVLANISVKQIDGLNASLIRDPESLVSVTGTTTPGITTTPACDKEKCRCLGQENCGPRVDDSSKRLKTILSASAGSLGGVVAILVITIVIICRKRKNDAKKVPEKEDNISLNTIGNSLSNRVHTRDNRISNVDGASRSSSSSSNRFGPGYIPRITLLAGSEPRPDYDPSPVFEKPTFQRPGSMNMDYSRHYSPNYDLRGQQFLRNSSGSHNSGMDASRNSVNYFGHKMPVFNPLYAEVKRKA